MKGPASPGFLLLSGRIQRSGQTPLSGRVFCRNGEADRLVRAPSMSPDPAGTIAGTSLQFVERPPIDRSLRSETLRPKTLRLRRSIKHAGDAATKFG
jgi:hypothetical protein